MPCRFAAPWNRDELILALALYFESVLPTTDHPGQSSN